MGGNNLLKHEKTNIYRSARVLSKFPRVNVVYFVAYMDESIYNVVWQIPKFGCNRKNFERQFL